MPSPTSNAPPYAIIPAHTRTNSSSSVLLQPPAITLEDHTLDPSSSSTTALWAQHVSIPSYTVVSPSTSSPPSTTPTSPSFPASLPSLPAELPNAAGAYTAFQKVCYTIHIQPHSGTTITLRKRYSDFDKLRAALCATFGLRTDVPPLPRKSLISKFRGEFLEKRRRGLEYFLSCVLLHPEFAASPVLKDFIFS